MVGRAPCRRHPGPVPEHQFGQWSRRDNALDDFSEEPLANLLSRNHPVPAHCAQAVRLPSRDEAPDVGDRLGPWRVSPLPGNKAVSTSVESPRRSVELRPRRPNDRPSDSRRRRWSPRCPEKDEAGFIRNIRSTLTANLFWPLPPGMSPHPGDTGSGYPGERLHQVQQCRRVVPPRTVEMGTCMVHITV